MTELCERCGEGYDPNCQQCHESRYEPFMGCLFHGRGQAGDPCTCGPVGPVDKSEDPESSFDGPLLGDVFDEGESEGGSAEAKPASPSPSLGPDLKTCAVGEVTITQRVEAHRVDREDRYGVDRNEHEPSFACSESEFARDDEFKALQKAHQRLKGRYKKLERTVTLKDQIIKTREFEISELRKGLR